MTIQHRPNQDAIYQAINIYRDAMRPFILRNLKNARYLEPEHRYENLSDIDVGDFPHLVRKYWTHTFSHRFDPDRDMRSTIGIIREGRNQMVHADTGDLSDDSALAQLHHIAEVLGEINAPAEKRAVEAIRAETFDRIASQKAATPEKPKQPRRKVADLTPWRDVITPNPDVINDTFKKSEFAADLQEVFEGKAKTAEYGETEIFFNQTYITPGLRQLLVNALKRLGGKGGDPVIQLKTGFGGGKTHSLIALYHLVTGMDILRDLPREGKYARLCSELDEIFTEAEWDPATPMDAAVSVLVGTYLSTTDADETQQGDPLNTLWGKMADQLGGQDAYDIIADAARQGISPGGSQLDALFKHVGPSVILIDELVAYVRNVHDVTQDSISTFFQAVTESVNRSENVILIATLPESKVETGGEGGHAAMASLESILERVHAVSIPLVLDNAFEVVRRRLFGSEINEAERDATCEAFRRMYQNAKAEYPEGVSDQNYLQRMKACYPIHPEIFDRLSQDWAAIPGFQRTRGVLRMMATCISRLYREHDTSLLIMPGNLTLNDSALSDEFTKLLGRAGGNWDPVVQEIESYGSRVDQIDQKSQNFIDVGGAARRIARTIFLGSAPSGAVKGIRHRDIHLGTVEPGHGGVSTYNDALSRMGGALYFLYNLDERYYFHAEENLNKVAIDRAAEYKPDDIFKEVVKRLERLIGRDSQVHVCPDSPSAVKDSAELQYVVLHPQVSIPSRSKEEETAQAAALAILTGDTEDARQRSFRNTLLFITARQDDLRELSNLMKHYLAWHSIMNGDDLHSRIGNLEGERADQTRENLETNDDEVTKALFKAYRWGLAPLQADEKEASYDFSTIKARSTDARLMRRFREQFTKDEAIIPDMSVTHLTEKLQRYIWSSEPYQYHIEIDRLWELMAQNVYMPRLKDRNVLAACIRDGVEQGSFGYAAAYQDDDYQHFRFEAPIGRLRIEKGTSAVLINPELAAVIKAGQEGEPPPDPAPPVLHGVDSEDEKDSGMVDPVPPKGPTHVVVRKVLPLELPFTDDLDTLQSEIVTALQADGGNVVVEITLTANKPGGFSENIARAVKQNCEHIKAEFKAD